MDNPWATSEPWQPEDPVRPDDDWDAPWGTTPSSETPSDQWETPRQETEPHPPAAPPQWLDALLHHSQQVSEEIWPASESGNDGDWKSGFGDLADIADLLAQLAPANPTLPPVVQFSATATAKAMNEALKLTRHLPVSASSPLSRLLAAKGSLDWEKSIKTKQEVIPETVRVGWRVLEKEDRLSTVEESKPKRASSGFLSFWSRRTSGTQAAPVEPSGERSTSPARSSLESVKAPHPPTSQSASPQKASTTPVPPPPPTDTYSTGLAPGPAPSAVSRFLNRFSLAKNTQHSALALSSDDLEFLSDIVPSANDPPDEDSDRILGTLADASSSSPLPLKLPPPIPPPPKHFTLSAHSSAVLGAPDVAGVPAVQGASHTNVPVLASPLSPKPASSFTHTQNALSLNDVPTPTIAFEPPSTSIQQRFNLGHHSLRPRSISPLQAVPPLSLPPLLPPPPISPPQTPRPNTFSFFATSTATVQSSGNHEPDGSDDEFSAFASSPAPASAPFPSLYSGPPLRSPSPPSPPPRRTYNRTHYPSSSSTSSILSPASQSSVDRLYPTTSSISASLDGFDDFVSASAAREEGRGHTPPPPPLPAKSPSQHRQLPPIDTHPPRTPYSHTPSQSFASPTVHTSLMSSVPLVSNAEHQRTQALVNQAAARGGLLWPNSPVLDESKVQVIPPPPSMSPPPMSGESFDLLGGGDTLGGRVEVDPVGVRTPFDVGDKALSLRLQPSPPPSSMSAPVFSTLGMPEVGALPPTKPKQMGGLSAQDLSFFEGL